MAGKFLSVADLIARAKSGPLLTLVNETFQAFPAPVRQPDGMKLAFLYGRCKLIPGPGRLLYPPHHVAYLNAETGQLDLMREVSPGEFGSPGDHDEPVGEHTIGRGMSYEEFQSRRERLCAAFDELLAAFAAGRAGADARSAAIAFNTLFDCLGEAPLQPYREAVGREFHAWLRTLSPRGGS